MAPVRPPVLRHPENSGVSLHAPRSTLNCAYFVAPTCTFIKVVHRPWLKFSNCKGDTGIVCFVGSGVQISNLYRITNTPSKQMTS